ncbi:hypothetical protein V8G54_017193 [Vigna mungo]|uniref:Uncharacterized protein n=1 Tax=Vigna mungo TaxID=3915 RepID=A0AAQ3S1I5_VIGMU
MIVDSKGTQETGKSGSNSKKSLQKDSYIKTFLLGNFRCPRLIPFSNFKQRFQSLRRSAISSIQQGQSLLDTCGGGLAISCSTDITIIYYILLTTFEVNTSQPNKMSIEMEISVVKDLELEVVLCTVIDDSWWATPF